MGDAKVLVIGIDGLRWDRVANADAPHLTRLEAEGLFAPSLLKVVPGVATDSGPGWSTIASGVWADKHGVADNQFVGAKLAEFPDFLSRAKRANPALTTFAAVDWPPLAEQGVFGVEIDTLVVGDGEENGYLVEDARLTERAVEALKREELDAAFVYLGAVDIAGHGRGALSAEYATMVNAVDGHVGELLAAVRGRSSYARERWLILLTTDHGHRDEGGHGGYTDAERGTFMLAYGPGVGAGRRDGTYLVDVAATVLAHLGIAVPEELDGRPLWT
jgi:predicted AlkP superfamily pyrophosphatase or phosphodiesterase